mgnify:CR=1 FL=1|jgi:hypothetical protein
MPFSGGGGGQLPNHQHTLLPLDGGPLDAAGVTVASLTAGSIMYSDGANLQELLIGGAGELMEVAGGIPTWQPAAPPPAAPAGYNYKESFVLGADSPTWTVTLTDPWVYASGTSLVLYLQGKATGGAVNTNLTVSYNAHATNFFNNCDQQRGTATYQMFEAVVAAAQVMFPQGGFGIDDPDAYNLMLQWVNNPFTGTNKNFIPCNYNFVCPYQAQRQQGWFWNEQSGPPYETEITTVTFGQNSGDIAADSRVDVYEVTR